MKIGLFTDTYLPDINGVVSSVELLRKKLIDMDHEVYVICTYPGLLKVQKEDNIIRLPGIEFKKLYGYAVASPFHLFLIEDIKTLELDIIHVHTEFGVGIFAQMCADRLHIPLVRTYHTTYEDYTHYVNFIDSNIVDKAAKKIVANLSKLYGEKCMRLISPSIKTKDMLIRYGIKTPIEIIPTGTELERFNPKNTSCERINQIRKECGIKEDEKMLLYVGRVAKEKSIDILLETFKYIKEDNLKIKLVIIGGGPDLDTLIEMSKKLNIESHVFFGNKRDFKDVPAYYHSADAFVSASTSETQGMTYIEALASGLIIFARRDECVSELLIENETGYYFDDSKELKDKIIKLLALKDDEYKKMSNNGLEIVKPYDANIFGSRIMDIYKVAISEYHHYYVIDSIKLKNDYVVLVVKNSNRNKDEILISLDTFYQLGLRIGQKISFEIIDQLKDEEKSVIAYRGALKKLAIRDYTIKAMYDFLLHKYELPIHDINIIIDKLEERELLNDYKYAVNKVDSLNLQALSRKSKINHLRKDGVPSEIIEKVTIYDEDEEYKNAYKLANKYQNSIKNKSLKQKKQTIIKKLMLNGYNYDVANRALKSLDMSDDIYNEVDVLKKEANNLYNKYKKKYQGYELRNKLYYSLLAKGFSSENIYAILNEIEVKDE